MQITFNTPKSIVVTPEQRRSTTKLTIQQLIDSPSQKTVVAFTREAGRITLWEGAAYDAIGQWTDTDVENRIREMYP